MLPLLLAFLALSVKAQNTVRDCSSGKSLFTFVSGSLLPSPVVPGENATLSLSAEIPAGTTVADGTAKYSLSFNGIPFSPTTEDLCSQVACPLVAGPYTNSSVSVFPTGVSGKLVTKIQWFDDASTLLLCTEVTTKV
uniref:MD-2-related lipid-recognition domain-containing protein n=1 Tax=viral metagenome TaxID=1070528 RepID=A0A6C0BJ23_9ZZZZ